MPFDAIEPLFNAVEATVLHCDLRLKMRKLRLQVSQVHFQTRHTNFEVAHFVGQRVHGGLQALLAAPEAV